MITSFWRWFFKGTANSSGEKLPGYKCIYNKFLLLHLIIATIATAFIDIQLTTLAITCAIVFSVALFAVIPQTGATFHDIIKSKEIKLLMDEHIGGYQFYTNNYILTNRIAQLTLVSWFFAATGLFEHNTSLFGKEPYTPAIPFALFFLTSMSIRSLWSFTTIVQMLATSRRTIEIELEKHSEPPPGPSPDPQPLLPPPGRPLQNCAPPQGSRPGARGNTRPPHCPAPRRPGPPSRPRP